MSNRVSGTNIARRCSAGHTMARAGASVQPYLYNVLSPPSPSHPLSVASLSPRATLLPSTQTRLRPKHLPSKVTLTGR